MREPVNSGMTSGNFRLKHLGKWQVSLREVEKNEFGKKNKSLFGNVWLLWVWLWVMQEKLSSRLEVIWAEDQGWGQARYINVVVNMNLEMGAGGGESWRLKDGHSNIHKWRQKEVEKDSVKEFSEKRNLTRVNYLKIRMKMVFFKNEKWSNISKVTDSHVK